MNFISNNVKLLIQICIIIMSLAVFGLIVLVSFSRQKGNKKVREYDSVNNRLKEHKRKIFDYSKINDFLIANGAPYHWPWMAEPLKFISASIAFGGILALLGSLVNVILCIIGFCVGIFVPYILVRSDNKQDNNLILEDIKLIYNVLFNQIKAGVFISDALSEFGQNSGTNKMITNKRLAIEMQNLATDIYFTSNVNDAMDSFVRKFDNMYITSLGVVIKQSLESGMASEALQDITEQLKEVEKNLLMMKRERKSFRNFIFQLLLLLGIIITMFAFIFPQISSMMANF